MFDDEVKAGVEPDALHAYSILADNYNDFFSERNRESCIGFFADWFWYCILPLGFFPD